ncbi:MAG: chorismate synthase [Bacillota bacterium]
MLENIKFEIFGESHGAMIGVTVTGIPAGVAIDEAKLALFMARRKSVKEAFSTPRMEADEPIFVAGVYNGVTTGAPITAVIQNTSQRSNDYNHLSVKPRPSHADYVASVKYGGHSDMRGGGHFSGRLTAPLCILGFIAKEILKSNGITVEAYVSDLGGVHSVSYKETNLTTAMIEELREGRIPTLCREKEAEMLDKILASAKKQDSLGGAVECVVDGVPVGFGDALWSGLEGKIAHMLFGVPAVKGVEFGSGFDLINMSGSEANDDFYINGDKIATTTNNSGGINGGISNGMQLTMRAAFRPTPSISCTQQTVDISTGKAVSLNIGGRHDQCIVPRAVAPVESAVAIAILDGLKTFKASQI